MVFEWPECDQVEVDGPTIAARCSTPNRVVLRRDSEPIARSLAAAQRLALVAMASSFLASFSCCWRSRSR